MVNKYMTLDAHVEHHVFPVKKHNPLVVDLDRSRRVERRMTVGDLFERLRINDFVFLTGSLDHKRSNTVKKPQMFALGKKAPIFFGLTRLMVITSGWINTVSYLTKLTDTSYTNFWCAHHFVFGAVPLGCV